MSTKAAEGVKAILFSVITSSSAKHWEDGLWDAFVEGHTSGHPLQLSAWGALKREFGWEDVRLALLEQGELLAGTQVLFRAIPRLGLLPQRIAYVPKGPLLSWGNPSQVQALFRALDDLCRKHRALLVKIEPEVTDSPELTQTLQAQDYSHSERTIQPRSTVWIDLTPAEDEILARMKQKWRYNVRLAARKGVTVRIGDAEDVELFSALAQTTGDRNEFGVHSVAYYRRFWELFHASGAGALFIAEHETTPLAALMVATCAGKAYYLYGASSNIKRNLMPSHLLQWQTMRWAKEQGCSAYDLWGIPDEVGVDPDTQIPDPATGLWGVWRFKRGFGGTVTRTTGAWDKYYVPVAGLARRMGMIFD